jgi:hypothetical protein
MSMRQHLNRLPNRMLKRAVVFAFNIAVFLFAVWLAGALLKLTL